jgi:hypothetical protein
MSAGAPPGTTGWIEKPAMGTSQALMTVRGLGGYFRCVYFWCACVLGGCVAGAGDGASTGGCLVRVACVAGTHMAVRLCACGVLVVGLHQRTMRAP